MEAIDCLVVPDIQRGIAAATSHPKVVLVLNEVGKMELVSGAFREAVLLAFNSRARALGTVMARAHPFADALKARPDVLLVSVTAANRESLPRQIAASLLGEPNAIP